MNKSKIDYVFDYLNNNDFRYHMEDGMPYKELSIEEIDILSIYITQLQQENQQLKIQISAREEECRKLEDNWNKLKKYINKTKINEFEKSFGKRYGKTFTQVEIIVCNMIKNKMQELERGVSDVEDKRYR